MNELTEVIAEATERTDRATLALSNAEPCATDDRNYNVYEHTLMERHKLGMNEDDPPHQASSNIRNGNLDWLRPQIPPADEVSAELEYLRTITKKQTHPVVKATLELAGLRQIHPCMSGNTRLAIATANRTLMDAGVFPLVLTRREMLALDQAKWALATGRGPDLTIKVLEHNLARAPYWRYDDLDILESQVAGLQEGRKSYESTELEVAPELKRRT